MRSWSWPFVLLLVCHGASWADGPRDNQPDDVRPIPPPGVEVAAADREELQQGLQQLESKLRQLRGLPDETLRELIPDVEVFYRAVHDALTYDEFFAPRDIEQAKEVLRAGAERAEQLLAGAAPWTTQKGLVVRGFRSRLDHTVQPYGLVIPESYTFRGPHRYRLDLWFHGRGERLSESNFIAGRRKQVGRIAPRDTIVLHPYGRYSNAFKFAGEVDVLEAWEHVRRHYRIDDDRVAVRGFSMGGAGCWQMAVHYPDRFFAANPGAGFSETPEFLKFFQDETLQPTWFEKKLWQWYDCPGYAVNLLGLPTIAYSGELDIQKQAADIMAAALHRERMSLVHVIGPQTKHSIHPDSLHEIEARLESLARQGRDPLPNPVALATYTLKYNRAHWVEITGLRQHWQPARVTAHIDSRGELHITTSNVTGLSLQVPAGRWPHSIRRSVVVEIDGRRYQGPRPGTDRSWSLHVWNGELVDQPGPPAGELYKRKDLQGPIDDAFMDSFLVVRPTGQAAHELVGQWSQSELDRFVQHWRKHFRGHVRIKNDVQVTDDDIASANLILFGDPASNQVLRRVEPHLPLRWDAEAVIVGDKRFDARHHAAVMIYPNPLNPDRYVVLNSGFTFREYAYLNNARQVPKLPDWAVIDLETPPDTLWPGKVAAADFFDEQWRLQPPR